MLLFIKFVVCAGMSFGVGSEVRGGFEMIVRDDVGSEGRHFSSKIDEKVHVNVTK